MPDRQISNDRMPEPFQHAQAVATIAIIDVLMSSVRTEAKGAFGKRVKKINDWLDLCASQTRARKHVSSGARRALLSFADALDRRGIKEHMDAGQRNERWAALAWTAYNFVLAVHAVCPLYHAGPQKKAWKYLRVHLESLAESERLEYPGCDEIGTGIYEECAWALEGVEFEAEQLRHAA